MGYTQLITPNPDIPDRPGYCLEYVRQTFNLPIRYGSATEAWENSASQHRNYFFPEGLWVPVWFAIDTVPEGHVALRAPDGTVYSDSDFNGWPHHHPSIGDLIAYYAYWGGMTLTYLGWTEDVASYPVISLDVIQTESTPPTQKDWFDMASVDDLVTAITKPEVLDAIALAILHRECKNIDPATGVETTVDHGPTLATKISWNAYLHDRENRALDNITAGLEELHTVVNKLLPVPTHSDAPVPTATPTTEVAV